MLVWSSMTPAKFELTPSVVAPATAKKTLHACAPPERSMVEAEPVMNVPAIWNIQTVGGTTYV